MGENFKYFEASAETNEGVEEVFTFIAKLVTPKE
jgi:hypothetical protein